MIRGSAGRQVTADYVGRAELTCLSNSYTNETVNRRIICFRIAALVRSGLSHVSVSAVAQGKDLYTLYLSRQSPPLAT